MTEDSIKEESQFESDRKEREATEKLAIEEDTAKEILGWIAEALITFLSIFVITAALLAFFGVLDIHLI
ncbi:hypothetical protein [Dakarella massiliensis]|uniref:hypothetical protein n=1 Tax=Dakarella massiliensis TaxID=1506471 RepID=UPI003A8F2477